MKVWIVGYSIPYERDENLGVFDSKDKAEEIFDKLKKKGSWRDFPEVSYWIEEITVNDKTKVNEELAEGEK